MNDLDPGDMQCRPREGTNVDTQKEVVYEWRLKQKSVKKGGLVEGTDIDRTESDGERDSLEVNGIQDL